MAVVPDSTVTQAQLAAHISRTPDEAKRIYDEALLIVTDAFASAWRDVPVEFVDECVYRVGRSLRDIEKKASTGAAQVTATEAAPFRVPSDPLASSYSIIRRYVALGL